MHKDGWNPAAFVALCKEVHGYDMTKIWHDEAVEFVGKVMNAEWKHLFDQAVAGAGGLLK